MTVMATAGTISADVPLLAYSQEGKEASTTAFNIDYVHEHAEDTPIFQPKYRMNRPTFNTRLYEYPSRFLDAAQVCILTDSSSTTVPYLMIPIQNLYLKVVVDSTGLSGGNRSI